MKKVILAAVIFVIAALFIGGVSAADQIGGDQSKIIIKSNAEGANVVLYDISGNPGYTGIIQNGEAVIYVYSTATPLKTAVVYGDGYKPNYAPITTPPAGQPATYTINLEAVAPMQMGGSFGFIQVVTNVVGANVELHDINHKTVQTGVADNNGVVTFEVYTTATPASYAFASANGYKHNSVYVTMPAAGKTTSVYVYLEPTYNPTVTPSTPTPTETTPAASPLGAVGLLGLLGAAFLLRKE